MTEKKLAEEQQNLVRVNDILSELTRQLEPLERQSETAKIYLKKKEELSSSISICFCSRWSASGTISRK